MKVLRTREQLSEALREQRAALKASSEAYDRGEFWEAKRLATTTYTLLHDGAGRTKSLLEQLKLKRSIQYVNSNSGLSGGSNVPLCIVRITAGTGGRYLPRCTAGSPIGFPKSRMVQFNEWWEDPIYVTAAGLHLTRKNLVFGLRSKDGGAHFDAELKDDPYYWLTAKGDANVSTSKDEMTLWVSSEKAKTGNPIQGGHLASMRQIAWELEESLKAIESHN